VQQKSPVLLVTGDAARPLQQLEVLDGTESVKEILLSVSSTTDGVLEPESKHRALVNMHKPVEMYAKSSKLEKERKVGLYSFTHQDCSTRLSLFALLHLRTCHPLGCH